MDEDDYMWSAYGGFKSSPFWRNGDEYAVARRQMQEANYEKTHYEENVLGE